MHYSSLRLMVALSPVLKSLAVLSLSMGLIDNGITPMAGHRSRYWPVIRVDVCWLPKEITPKAVQEMNTKVTTYGRGRRPVTGAKTLSELPFVVPGGRFNELYGWDSYMESLGLIANDKVHLAKKIKHEPSAAEILRTGILAALGVCSSRHRPS